MSEAERDARRIGYEEGYADGVHDIGNRIPDLISAVEERDRLLGILTKIKGWASGASDTVEDFGGDKGAEDCERLWQCLKLSLEGLLGESTNA